MSSNREEILIVDDDEAVRSALKFALEIDGFAVRVYESGAALLAEREVPPGACLLVDHRMPDLDGLQLVEALRARQGALPWILMVSRLDEDVQRRAAELGATSVVEKPFMDGTLVHAIRMALATID